MTNSPAGNPLFGIDNELAHRAVHPRLIPTSRMPDIMFPESSTAIMVVALSYPAWASKVFAPPKVFEVRQGTL